MVMAPSSSSLVSQCGQCRKLKSDFQSQINAFKVLASMNPNLSWIYLVQSLEKILSMMVVEEQVDVVVVDTQKPILPESPPESVPEFVPEFIRQSAPEFIRQSAPELFRQSAPELFRESVPELFRESVQESVSESVLSVELKMQTNNCVFQDSQDQDSQDQKVEQVDNISHETEQVNDISQKPQDSEPEEEELIFIPSIRRSRNQWKGQWENTCRQILDDLWNHEDSFLFRHPVTLKGYTNVIKNPMCLDVIKEKLYGWLYLETMEFHRDIFLIFENCRIYNSDTTSNDQIKIRQQCNRLEQYYTACVQKLNLFKNSTHNNKDKKLQVLEEPEPSSVSNYKTDVVVEKKKRKRKSKNVQQQREKVATSGKSKRKHHKRKRTKLSYDYQEDAATAVVIVDDEENDSKNEVEGTSISNDKTDVVVEKEKNKSKNSDKQQDKAVSGKSKRKLTKPKRLLDDDDDYQLETIKWAIINDDKKRRKKNKIKIASISNGRIDGGEKGKHKSKHLDKRHDKVLTVSGKSKRKASTPKKVKFVEDDDPEETTTAAGVMDDKENYSKNKMESTSFSNGNTDIVVVHAEHKSKTTNQQQDKVIMSGKSNQKFKKTKESKSSKSSKHYHHHQQETTTPPLAIVNDEGNKSKDKMEDTSISNHKAGVAVENEGNMSKNSDKQQDEVIVAELSNGKFKKTKEAKASNNDQREIAATTKGNPTKEPMGNEENEPTHKIQVNGHGKADHVLTNDKLKAADASLVTVRNGDKKAYKCTICENAMKTLPSARLHVRRVHYRDRLSCDHCHKLYYDATTLRRHLIDRHNVAPMAHRFKTKGIYFDSMDDFTQPPKLKMTFPPVKKPKIQKQQQLSSTTTTSTTPRRDEYKSYKDITVTNPFENFNLKKALRVKVCLERVNISTLSTSSSDDSHEEESFVSSTVSVVSDEGKPAHGIQRKDGQNLEEKKKKKFQMKRKSRKILPLKMKKREKVEVEIEKEKEILNEILNENSTSIAIIDEQNVPTSTVLINLIGQDLMESNEAEAIPSDLINCVPDAPAIDMSSYYVPSPVNDIMDLDDPQEEEVTASQLRSLSNDGSTPIEIKRLSTGVYQITTTILSTIQSSTASEIENNNNNYPNPDKIVDDDAFFYLNKSNFLQDSEKVIMNDDIFQFNKSNSIQETEKVIFNDASLQFNKSNFIQDSQNPAHDISFQLNTSNFTQDSQKAAHDISFQLNKSNSTQDSQKAANDDVSLKLNSSVFTQDTQVKLKISYQQVRENIEEIVVQRNGESCTVYRCVLCFKTFIHAASCSRHIKQIHFGEKEKCSHCSKIFSAKMFLVSHQKTCNMFVVNKAKKRKKGGSANKDRPPKVYLHFKDKKVDNVVI